MQFASFLFNFLFFVNILNMKRKEYIQKMAKLIENRVRFHAPVVFDDEVDFELLDAVGIDKNLPVFKFEKLLTKNLYKAFKQAQRAILFNLILTNKNTPKKSWLKHLKNCYILEEDECGYNLLSSINKMNINYYSQSAFSPAVEEEYLKINGEVINLCYKPYYLSKKASSEGIIYDIKEFVLSGKNYSISFTNTHKERRVCVFEINIPLPRGYYHFASTKTGVKITNLTNKVTEYFNFNHKNANLSFSCIDGLESSTLACINLRIKLELRPLEQRRFYFNYGANQYLLNSPKEVDNFFQIAQQKTLEKFDIKVRTKDKLFDEKFNNILPQKIWNSWNAGQCDNASESEYIKLKNSIIKESEKGYFINEDFKGLKEVKIYQNNEYKRVFIIEGESRYIMSEKTKFFNFTQVAKDFFVKNNEIYLCFGK